MRVPALTALVLVLLLPAVSEAGGGIFSYTEPDGTVVYTNVPPSGAKKARRLSGTFTSPVRVTDDVPKARASTPDYDDHIALAAKKYKIPVALVRAIMHAESAFNPMALSPKGASGLMQLMPETAQEMYVKDIFEPRDNIEGGTRYLRVLANLYDGDMVKMVAAYNAGPAAVAKYGGKVPPYAETQAYVRKVIALYFQYKQQARAAQPAESTQVAQNEEQK